MNKITAFAWFLTAILWVILAGFCLMSQNYLLVALCIICIVVSSHTAYDIWCKRNE